MGSDDDRPQVNVQELIAERDKLRGDMMDAVRAPLLRLGVWIQSGALMLSHKGETWVRQRDVLSKIEDELNDVLSRAMRAIKRSTGADRG